jgi:predicted secreted protein
MATPNIIDPVYGELVTVNIANATAPTVFTHPAIINTSRSISFSTKTADSELVDLANPGYPAQTTRRVQSFDTKIDGAGSLPKTSAFEYSTWATSGEVRNVKVQYANTIVTGPFILTDFQISGERLEIVQAQLTLQQAGPVTVTGS